MAFVSSLVTRLLLSVWLFSPCGRVCGSFRSVWLDSGTLCVWGGVVVPVTWSGKPPYRFHHGVLGVADAWELCRFFWR